MSIERLNACFDRFPEATKALLHHCIPCPPGMEEFAIPRDGEDGTRMVTLLGLLNGTLFQERGQRMAYVTKEEPYPSRDAELADVERYTWIAESKFHSGPVVTGTVGDVEHTTTNKERHEALLRVVEFAKSQGFTKAEVAMWDPDNPESSANDEDELLMDNDPGTYPLDVGVYLHKAVNFTKTEPVDCDEDGNAPEDIFLSKGEAP